MSSTHDTLLPFALRPTLPVAIRQGWSREPVVIDLAGMQFKQQLPIVLGHDYSLGSILGQTTSVRVEAGKLIVEGAVGMVEMALAKLDERSIASLTPEQRSQLVSNLLIVLCSDRASQPVLPVGSGG